MHADKCALSCENCLALPDLPDMHLDGLLPFPDSEAYFAVVIDISYFWLLDGKVPYEGFQIQSSWAF